MYINVLCTAVHIMIILLHPKCSHHCPLQYNMPAQMLELCPATSCRDYQHIACVSIALFCVNSICTVQLKHCLFFFGLIYKLRSVCRGGLGGSNEPPAQLVISFCSSIACSLVFVSIIAPVRNCGVRGKRKRKPDFITGLFPDLQA